MRLPCQGPHTEVPISPLSHTEPSVFWIKLLGKWAGTQGALILAIQSFFLAGKRKGRRMKLYGGTVVSEKRWLCRHRLCYTVISQKSFRLSNQSENWKLLNKKGIHAAWGHPLLYRELCLCLASTCWDSLCLEEGAGFLKEEHPDFASKHPSPEEILFFWNLGPTTFQLKQDLLDLEITPKGKRGCLKTKSWDLASIGIPSTQVC